MMFDKGNFINLLQFINDLRNMYKIYYYVEVLKNVFFFEYNIYIMCCFVNN